MHSRLRSEKCKKRNKNKEVPFYFPYRKISVVVPLPYNEVKDISITIFPKSIHPSIHFYFLLLLPLLVWLLLE